MTTIEKSKATKAHELYIQITSHKSKIVSSILEIGRLLYILEEEKLYKFLDCDTFEEFLGSPEISFSRTSAYNYMKLHRLYVEELKFKPEELCDIAQGKLLIASQVIKEEPKEWLIKAKELSRSDLKSEVAEVLKKIKKPGSRAFQISPPSLPDLAQYKSYEEYVKNRLCLICRKGAIGHHFPKTRGAGADKRKMIPLCFECHSESHVNAKEWLWLYREKIFDYFYKLIFEIFRKETP